MDGALGHFCTHTCCTGQIGQGGGGILFLWNINTSPVNTIHWPNAGLMLEQRRRHWANIKPASGHQYKAGDEPASSSVTARSVSHYTHYPWKVSFNLGVIGLRLRGDDSTKDIRNSNYRARRDNTKDSMVFQTSRTEIFLPDISVSAWISGGWMVPQADSQPPQETSGHQADYQRPWETSGPVLS